MTYVQSVSTDDGKCMDMALMIYALINKDRRTVYFTFLFLAMRTSDAIADELIGSLNDVADKQRNTGCQ
jgi:hypothetical protein